MIGYTQITRKQFYELGGFANPKLVRVRRGYSMAYYERKD